MPATSVEPTVPTVESAEVVPASVRAVMNSVVAVPMMVRSIGTFGVTDFEARVGSPLVFRSHGLNGAPVRT
jgi:hypothetical protein